MSLLSNSLCFLSHVVRSCIEMSYWTINIAYPYIIIMIATTDHRKTIIGAKAYLQNNKFSVFPLLFIKYVWTVSIDDLIVWKHTCALWSNGKQYSFLFRLISIATNIDSGVSFLPIHYAWLKHSYGLWTINWPFSDKKNILGVKA